MISDNEKELLERTGIFILPPVIETEVLPWFIQATTLGHEMWPDQALRMYVMGFGGCSGTALAIANILKTDKLIHAFMVGEAISASGIIWAAAQKRYVYPYARMGVHPSHWTNIEGPIDGVGMYGKGCETFAVDRRNLHILTKASNKDLEWWRKHYFVRKDGMFWLDARKLKKIGMADIINPEGMMKNDFRNTALP